MYFEKLFWIALMAASLMCCGVGKVRLARSEIHHVNALLAEFVRFGDYGHGGRGFNAIDPFRKFYGRGSFVTGFCFRNWSHARFPLFLAFLRCCSLIAGSSFSPSLPL